jgi:hypothetical protein
MAFVDLDEGFSLVDPDGTVYDQSGDIPAVDFWGNKIEYRLLYRGRFQQAIRLDEFIPTHFFVEGATTTPKPTAPKPKPPVPKPRPPPVPDSSYTVPDSSYTTRRSEEKVWNLLSSAKGWPYRWGGGVDPISGLGLPWSEGRRGVDCAGFATMAIERLAANGFFSSKPLSVRWSAEAAKKYGHRVSVPQPGDLAVYVGHIEVVLRALPDGDAKIFGASGDHVQVKTSAKYFDPDKPLLGYYRVG